MKEISKINKKIITEFLLNLAEDPKLNQLYEQNPSLVFDQKNIPMRYRKALASNDLKKIQSLIADEDNVPHRVSNVYLFLLTSVYKDESLFLNN